MNRSIVVWVGLIAANATCLAVIGWLLCERDFRRKTSSQALANDLAAFALVEALIEKGKWEEARELSVKSQRDVIFYAVGNKVYDPSLARVVSWKASSLDELGLTESEKIEFKQYIEIISR